jgi:hypothetical protein
LIEDKKPEYFAPGRPGGADIRAINLAQLLRGGIAVHMQPLQGMVDPAFPNSGGARNAALASIFSLSVFWIGRSLASWQD